MGEMKADAIDATVTVIIDAEIDDRIDGTMIMKDLTITIMMTAINQAIAVVVAAMAVVAEIVAAVEDMAVAVVVMTAMTGFI